MVSTTITRTNQKSLNISYQNYWSAGVVKCVTEAVSSSQTQPSMSSVDVRLINRLQPITFWVAMVMALAAGHGTCRERDPQHGRNLVVIVTTLINNFNVGHKSGGTSDL